MIKSFTTNRFVGLWVTAMNGTPPFSALDITFTAETIFTSTAINRLANSTNTRSISMSGVGLSVDQSGQIWFMNGARIFGTLPIDENSDFDELVRKDYVDA